MSINRYPRGAVVRCYDKTWIVWDYVERQECYDALPVKAQTGPLHRSQLRLDVYGKSVVVHLLSSTALLPDDCRFVEQCDPATVSMIEVRMRRAEEANRFEAMNTVQIIGGGPRA